MKSLMFICVLISLAQSRAPFRKVNIFNQKKLGEDGKLTPRIFNGSVAEVGQFPYFTLLYIHKYPNTHVAVCGGSVIDENFILTVSEFVKILEKFIFKFFDNLCNFLNYSMTLRVVDKYTRVLFVNFLSATRLIFLHKYQP